MARILLVSACFLAAACCGCSLNRSAIGCQTGFGPDDTHRCVPLPDASTDAFVPTEDGGEDAGPDARVDAFIPDAFIPDAYMPDAPMDDGGTDAGPDAGPDSGPLDGGMPDACVAVAESCNGLDDNCDGRVDEGTVCDLRIAVEGVTGPASLFVRIAWNEPPPGGPRMVDYYVPCLLSGTTLNCRADLPELASGRIVQMFLVSDPGGLGAACTVAACPSLCTRTECPGYPPMAPYSYTIAYLVLPVDGAEVTLNPDPGTAADGPMPGDSAWLHFRLP